MPQETLIVPKRESFGKAAIRDLKASGMIPAVVYGLNEPPVWAGGRREMRNAMA